jgi:hypothetical protein
VGSYTKYNRDQPDRDKAIVLELIAERGPIPRSDLWQALHGRVTVSHVDQSLNALLQEGRIRATKSALAKPVNGPWSPGKVVPSPPPSMRLPESGHETRVGSVLLSADVAWHFAPMALRGLGISMPQHSGTWAPRLRSVASAVRWRTEMSDVDVSMKGSKQQQGRGPTPKNLSPAIARLINRLRIEGYEATERRVARTDQLAD